MIIAIYVVAIITIVAWVAAFMLIGKGIRKGIENHDNTNNINNNSN